MNEIITKPLSSDIPRIQQPQAFEQALGPKETSFGDWLNKSIASVNQMQQEGDHAAEKLLTGQNKDIHGTMIAMQKASISMSLMLEIRNKVISAYEEVKRMQF